MYTPCVLTREKENSSLDDSLPSFLLNLNHHIIHPVSTRAWASQVSWFNAIQRCDGSAGSYYLVCGAARSGHVLHTLSLSLHRYRIASESMVFWSAATSDHDPWSTLFHRALLEEGLDNTNDTTLSINDPLSSTLAPGRDSDLRRSPHRRSNNQNGTDPCQLSLLSRSTKKSHNAPSHPTTVA